MLSEFDLIQQYFTRESKRDDVLMAVGDDCAITIVPEGMMLATTVDTLISEVHFPSQTLPADIGYKSLAVSLSDLAAMGAEPAWFSLALSLPEVDESWLAAFSTGLFGLANEHNMTLIGGDTTKAPKLSITITAHGFIPKGKALNRSGAQTGDVIAVTGTLGEAALALPNLLSGIESPFASKLNTPTPRVAEGIKLRSLATSCLDISDGLCQDLSHICQASHVGAVIETALLPASNSVKSHPDYLMAALSGGDDYELLFTCAPDNVKHILSFATVIGQITDTQELIVKGERDERINLTTKGYAHFR